jgi:putative FmdB family regulatory protein
MPIYEYQCQSCDHKLEKLQRMNDPALTDCPSCNKSELRRLISAAGFRLKGAGWYETDFKQGNKRNLADSSDSKAPSEPKSDSGEGAKPAAKPETKSKSDSSSTSSPKTKPSSSGGSATDAA